MMSKFCFWNAQYNVSGDINEYREKGEMNQRHYSMIIQWDSRDNIFVVRVPELPGCVTHGDTYEEAVKQGQDAIESWIMAAIADNGPVPQPNVAA
jgi:predicted RNase H-like HicB family nuclease